MCVENGNTDRKPEASVKHLEIKTSQQLAEYCKRLADASLIAFDTEFVSEDSYRPDLCLIQVAVEGELAVIDTVACPDVDLFWQTLVEGDHDTLVHAGREEFLYCLRSTGKRPRHVLDVQIAAAFIGLEYPASYGKLLSHVFDVTLKKGETRTDWRRRPLSKEQIEYALLDVLHLEELWNHLRDEINKLERIEWFEDEMNAWQTGLEEAEQRENWRRVSGTSNLSPRSMAVAREVWRWREGVASDTDKPPRRVLRDDLIVELAKRQTADKKRIGSLRGMERRQLTSEFDNISRAIQTALDLPESELPRRMRKDGGSKYKLLGQFLATALSAICRDDRLSPQMVGTTSDLRELIEWQLDKRKSNDEPPALARGWRAGIIGQQIEDLVSGKLSIGVARAKSNQPLEFRRHE